MGSPARPRSSAHGLGATHGLGGDGRGLGGAAHGLGGDSRAGWPAARSRPRRSQLRTTAGDTARGCSREPVDLRGTQLGLRRARSATPSKERHPEEDVLGISARRPHRSVVTPLAVMLPMLTEASTPTAGDCCGISARCATASPSVSRRIRTPLNEGRNQIDVASASLSSRRRRWILMRRGMCAMWAGTQTRLRCAFTSMALVRSSIDHGRARAWNVQSMGHLQRRRHNSSHGLESHRDDLHRQVAYNKRSDMAQGG